MAASEPLVRFVRDALTAGRSRADIRTALKTAGWSDKHIETALGAFSQAEFTPPVPQPPSQLSQLATRNTFICVLLFTAMVFSAIYVTVLGHALVDLWFLDPGDQLDRVMKKLNWAIAVLVVVVPLFIWLTWYDNRQAVVDASYRRSLIRKRLTYLTLFISALVFASDAVLVIYAFLDDQITMRFLLDIGVVSAVSAGVFIFYLRDAEDMKTKPDSKKPEIG